MTAVTSTTAKVMSKGQITLPKTVRAALGLDTGDTVILIQRGEKVVMMNSAAYAMQVFQDAMAGEADRAGLKSDEDVVTLIKDLRREKE